MLILLEEKNKGIKIQNFNVFLLFKFLYGVFKSVVLNNTILYFHAWKVKTEWQLEPERWVCTDLSASS